MAKVTPIEKLDSEIEAILEEYKDDIQQGMDEAKVAVGKAGVKALRASCKQFHGTGEYARGWTVNEEKSRVGNKVVIWNKKKPSLTHLLEYGHAKDGKKGGRVPAYVHIAPVEEKVAEAFEKKVKMVIEKG